MSDKSLHVPEARDGFIETLNQTGFMTIGLDAFSQAFVDFSATTQKPVLDIGAAFGVASIAALKTGATVIANDIDERHLALLQKEAPRQYRNKLILNTDSFPDSMQFEEGSLDAVLASRVMHFFDGNTIEKGARKIFSWLANGGKVFITGESVYVGTMTDFIKEYEQRVVNGDKWPGYFDDIHNRCDPRVRNSLPPSKHFCSESMLTRVFQEAGFTTEKCESFARPEFPKWLQLDGRESVGLIARKEL